MTTVTMSSATNDTNDALFTNLKTVCQECLTKPSTSTVKRLSDLISGIDAQYLVPISRYLLFPLQHILSSHTKDPLDHVGVICEACQCLIILLERPIILDDFATFAELYVSLFWLADDRPVGARNDDNVISAVKFSHPEDLKSWPIEAAYNVVKHSSHQVIRTALEDQLFIRALGHSTSVLLSVATNTDNKSLQISCMKMLEVLLIRSKTCWEVTKKDEREVKLSYLSGIWRNFLPGVSIAVMKLLSRDDKNPQGLFKASLSILSLIISTSYPKSFTVPSEVEEKSKFEETCDKLNMVVSQVSHLTVTHRFSAVRKSLLSLVTELIESSTPSLVDSLSNILLDILLTLSSDSQEDLEKDAKSSLTSFLRASPKVMEIFEETVVEALDKLIDINEVETMKTDERRKAIKKLHGVLSITSEEMMDSLLSCPSHRHRVGRFLVTCCRLTSHQKSVTKGANVLTGDSTCDPDQLIDLAFFPQNDEESGYATLICVIQVLGSKIPPFLLDDLISELLDDRPTTKSFESLLFAVNHMIFGLNCSYNVTDDIYWHHISRCCRVLQEVVSNNSSSEQLVQQIIGMTPLSFLLLRGLEVSLSKVNPSKEREEILLSALFLSFHFIPSSQRIITVLAKVLGHLSTRGVVQEKLSSILQLLQDHYIAHTSITSPILPITLKNVLPFCDISDERTVKTLVPFVTLLLESLDSCYTSKPKNLLASIHHVASFLSGNSLSVTSGDTISSQLRQLNITGQFFHNRQDYLIKLTDFEVKWKQFLTDYKTTQEFNEEVEAEDMGEEENKEMEMNNDDNHWKKKELLPKLQMLKDILDRMTKILSSPDSDDRIIVLKIISVSSFGLKEEEDSLLPLVHRMWKQLVLRLSDSEVAVAKTAFEVLFMMSSVCGDFIRQRFSTDVLPRILSFLTSHTKDGIRKETRIGHRFTITFHYQRESLSKLGGLVVGMDVFGRNLWRVIQVLLSYVCVQQPKELSEAAVNSLMVIHEMEPDAVWYYCQKEFPSCQSKCPQDRNLLQPIFDGEKLS